MKQFTKAVCEKIGYYVYILKDLQGNVFYIGKGKDNRVFQHVQCAISDSTKSDKLDLIRKIGSENVKHYILRHGLSEEQAFEIESACIDLLGLDTISNIVSGHDTWERGLKSVDEIIQLYDAKVIDISEDAMIIIINKLYKRFMSPPQLYQATRSAWRIAEFRRKKVKYAIASYHGIVREIYKIDSWNQTNSGRWEFTGSIADSSIRDKYLNQSLENYIKKNQQNPIRFTF